MHELIVGKTGCGKTGLLISKIMDNFLNNRSHMIIIDIKGDLSNVLSPSDPELGSFTHPYVLNTMLFCPGIEPWTIDFYNFNQRNKEYKIKSLLTKFFPTSITNNYLAFAYLTSLIDQYNINNLNQLYEIAKKTNIRVNSLNEGHAFKEKDKLLQILNAFLTTNEYKYNNSDAFPLDFEFLFNNNWNNFTRKDYPVSKHVICFNFSHLTPENQIYYLAFVLNEFRNYLIYKNTDKIEIYIDEISAFMPPVSKPETKPVLVDLLRKARGFNVDLILSTQNLNDVDYKALDNFNIMYIGMAYEKTLEKMDLYIEDYSKALFLAPRQFSMYKEGKYIQTFKTKTLPESFLAPPIHPEMLFKNTNTGIFDLADGAKNLARSLRNQNLPVKSDFIFYNTGLPPIPKALKNRVYFSKIDSQNYSDDDAIYIPIIFATLYHDFRENKNSALKHPIWYIFDNDKSDPVFLSDSAQVHLYFSSNLFDYTTKMPEDFKVKYFDIDELLSYAKRDLENLYQFGLTPVIDGTRYKEFETWSKPYRGLTKIELIEEAMRSDIFTETESEGLSMANLIGGYNLEIDIKIESVVLSKVKLDLVFIRDEKKGCYFTKNFDSEDELSFNYPALPVSTFSVV